MIVWIENGVVRRYDPVANDWKAGSSVGRPEPHFSSQVLWTGSEMIVWGGEDGNGNGFNDGGRYNPVSNSWVPISATGPPPARYGHTMIWTGSEMIVWGGGGNGTLNDTWSYTPGGRIMYLYQRP